VLCSRNTFADLRHQLWSVETSTSHIGQYVRRSLRIWLRAIGVKLRRVSGLSQSAAGTSTAAVKLNGRAVSEIIRLTHIYLRMK